jgi:pimeloyl-ACP methyl ester carboxylesterase
VSATRELFVTDRGSGPAVVFVHGQPGLGSDFDAVATLLVDDHRVIAPDRPGYGASGNPALSMAQNAGLLGALIEDRAASPATVVGHSYGGGVALLLAAARPELLSGLVLVDSVGREDSVNLFDHVLAAPVVGETVSAAGLLVVGRVLPRLRSLVSLAPGDMFRLLRVSLPDSSYREVASKWGRQVWRSFVFEQRALLREIGEVEASLPTIVAPTVVIAGTWDVVIAPSVAASIAASVAGAELVTVGHVGHFVPRDAPGVVASAVRRTEARAALLRADDHTTGDPARDDQA